MIFSKKVKSVKEMLNFFTRVFKFKYLFCITSWKHFSPKYEESFKLLKTFFSIVMRASLFAIIDLCKFFKKLLAPVPLFLIKHRI